MPMKIDSLRLALEGPNQSGKTALMLSGPQPLVMFAGELGFERAMYGGRWEFFKDFKVAVHEYDPKIKANKDLWRGNDITIFKLPKPLQVHQTLVRGYTELWDYFMARCGMAMADVEYVRTQSFDTMTEIRKMKAEAYLQSLQVSKPDREQLVQIEYGKVNPAIKDIYENCATVGQNVIASHHLTGEYKDMPNDKGKIERLPTGEEILDGLNTTYDLVDVALRLRGKNERKYSESGASHEEFQVEAEFRKCGFVPELRSTSLLNPTWDSLMNYMELRLGGRLEFPKGNEPRRP